MNELTDSYLTLALLLLADWSLRWGVVIALLALALAVCRPRRVATRLLLCRLVLAGGLLLPLVPHCWGPAWSSVEPAGRPFAAEPASLPAAAALPPSSPPAVPFHPPSPPLAGSSSGDPSVPIPQAASPSLGMGRALVLGTLLLWLTGVGLLLGRLVLGWVWLARLRRAARPVGATASAFLNQCREELSVRRTADLLTHQAVRAPVLLGGGHPAIIVPLDWGELPANSRRAALLHELTHLHHRDDWAKAGEEVIRAFFFFHPLVCWLLHRLDGERERRCDAAVVRHGLSPRQLAQVLLDFTERLGAGQPAVALGSALPFYHRITVKDRIHQLLEDDMTRWITPLSRGRRATLTAVVLGLMIALGGFGLRADAPGDNPAPAVAAPKEAKGAKTATVLEGRIVDVRGRPVPQAQIIGLCRAGTCVRIGGQKVTTDAQGHFRIEQGPEGPFPLGELTALQVETPGGKVFEVRTVAAEGQVEVRLPTLTGIKGPDNVGPAELAGVVVDEKGQPLAGVHVHVWDWVDHPDNQTRTGKDGIFRIKDCGGDAKVQVRFRKPGYSPVMFVQQPVGVKDLVVAMDSKTYFEGVVHGPDGKPAPQTLIRANQGPKMAEGCLISTVWTETTADAAGRYRLYVEPDAYEFLVKAPGVGVARLPKTPIAHGQNRPFDISLQPGVTFRARTMDAETGKPVAGVRLWHWEHKGVEGRSNDQGEVVISEMLSGKFEFSIEAAGYTRWWSDDAVSAWNRLQLDNPKLGWQRNFDYLDFDLKPDMKPVEIVIEKGVRITGRVLDPEGKPVGGATAAPALSGTGNSLTGDTRFSVATKADGSFDMLLPASGKAQYNLVAHDGKYNEWRKWANGVLPPIRTTPGQEINGLTLTLTRPATVRGTVVDAQGKPIAGCKVRAHDAEKLENRYYDPTTTTKEDGSFELRFIRPGEQFIQAAPFWLTAEDAPGGSTRKLRLAAGHTVEGIGLVVAERPQ